VCGVCGHPGSVYNSDGAVDDASMGWPVESARSAVLQTGFIH
jgi:hypothetical protein